MSPRCMLLFVFGFVGGAVVINSAILVSLSVLLLVHFSFSNGLPALTQKLPRILRKDRPISLGIFPLASGDSLVLPDARGGETPGNGPWKLQEQNHARCNTSLKDEFLKISQSGPKTGSTDSDNMVHAASKAQKDDVIRQANAKNNNLPNNKNSDDVRVTQETTAPSMGTNNNEEKSEVQSIIESTPELDMDKEPKGFQFSSTPTKGIENKGFDRNTESLFEELSSAGTDLIGDVDEGADLLGMGREVENLILENSQLLETKNALNVVKNDLIAKLDELVCEKQVLEEELLVIKQSKSKLEERNKELEEELKKARAETEEARQRGKDEEDVSLLK
ncbi:Hypothetical predicted protein [Pelobates cultripes]|uniref:JNK-interacting protein leucine zipper II domain-containing protein n=1 Tax=Pelobates cultripes TaxID=61616 RepID=A0AAD1W763_PELCU|nr:Hypothetical predicted protein [Pelobates cultripes]